jgi:catechol 2,3-dioxygenase-like lactoylglutathione lyase family enzyme
MEHVGIVVDDLADAVAFFTQLGLEPQGEAPVEGDWVDASSGSMASGRRSTSCRPRQPRTTRADEVSHAVDRRGYQRAPANAPGIRHSAFAGEDHSEC